MSKKMTKTHRRWSQTLEQSFDDQIQILEEPSPAFGKVQIYNTCRVCMESNIELKSIYTKRNDDQIVDLISNLTDQPILRNDGLPEQICEDCFNKVYEANETIKMCRSSDERLKQLLREIQTMSEFGETPSNWPTTESKYDQKSTIPPIKPERDNDSETEYDEMIVEALESNIEGTDESISEFSANENHKTEETYEWACCMCINLFDTEKDLLAHVANSHEIPARCPQPGKKVECRLCLKRFTRIKNYNSHIKAVYEEKKLCPICGVAMQKRYLADHIMGHENPKAVKKQQRPKKRYAKRDKQCMECGKCFFYNAQLQTHVRAVHQGEKPFKCEICGLSYPYKDSLSTHMQKHSAERKFKCKICPAAAYIYRADLHFHMKRHYNGQARNFSCELCDFKFFTAKQLRAHSSTHDPDANWKCDLCEKSYRQQYTLVKHKFSEHQIPIKKRSDVIPQNVVKPTEADGQPSFEMGIKPVAGQVHETVDAKCDYFDGAAEHYIIFQNE